MFGRHSLHGTSHQSSCANFVSNPYYEIYRTFIAILVFFLSHNLKSHLELLKLSKLMKEERENILWNVKTCWISTFNPTIRVMAIYMPLSAKMAKDSPLIMSTKINFEHLCDVTFSSFFLVCCSCWKLSMHWSNLHRREMSYMQLCYSHKDLPRSILFSLNVD